MTAPKLMILGMDGATFTIIDRLVAQGKLPHLADLLARGTAGPLLSTVPPHTAAAWPTFLTGLEPGRHGILNFDEVTVGGYGAGARLVTSAAIAGRTFLDVASKAGLRVAAVRVPMTYPAWPVNGVLISGYPSPEQGDFTYPRALSASVPGMRDPSDAPSPQARADLLLDEVRQTTAIGHDLLAGGPLDVFAVVYQQSDVAHHWFWRYMDPASPAYDPAEAQGLGTVIEQVYRAIDAGIGDLLTFAGPDTTVLVVSDHGGCLAASRQFHLNVWLQSLGLLARKPVSLSARAYALRTRLIPPRARAWLKRQLGGALSAKAGAATEAFYFNLQDLDWSHTQAYRFAITAEVEGIMLNVAGRQPWGIVQPGDEVNKLRERIIRDLRALLTPEGEPLVRALYRREDLFADELDARCPDLVVIFHPAFRGGRALTGSIFSAVPLKDLEHNQGGWHEPEGILIAAGQQIAARRIEHARLLDMAPTILATLGVPVPAAMSGSVLVELAGSEGERLAATSPSEAALAFTPTAGDAEDDGAMASVGAANSSSRLSAEEEESVRERLRNLGYL
jgi:predicted AlkP superfamily phosphohydrolase/phosphomutase